MGRVASSRGVVTSHHPAQGRTARVPSVPAALGWLSRVRGAPPSGANLVGRREPRFGGRHRTSRSRVRWLRGVHVSRGPRRGTWRPDMHSGRVKAVFIRIRARSCTDRSSSRAPRHAHPAALRPPQSEERSDQIEAVGATCGPSRPKRLVVVTQGQGCRPATGSRHRAPSYKFTSTEHRARVDGRATARHLHGRTAHTVRCATVKVSAESAGAVASNVFLESLTTRQSRPTRTT